MYEHHIKNALENSRTMDLGEGSAWVNPHAEWEEVEGNYFFQLQSLDQDKNNKKWKDTLDHILERLNRILSMESYEMEETLKSRIKIAMNELNDL